MYSSSSFLFLPYPIAISKCTLRLQTCRQTTEQHHDLQMTYPCITSGLQQPGAQGKNTNLFWQVLDSPQWLGQETVNVEYHFNVWTLLCTPQFDIQSSCREFSPLA